VTLAQFGALGGGGSSKLLARFLGDRGLYPLGGEDEEGEKGMHDLSKVGSEERGKNKGEGFLFRKHEGGGEQLQ